MKNILKKYNVLDIRHLPEAHRELRFSEAVLCLQPGCSFVIKLDKMPASLISHLENQLSDKFRWRMLQDGPDVWMIQITRDNERAA